VHFGVREHAMAAICNGMMAHGGVRPFCATFLNFIGYALGTTPTLMYLYLNTFNHYVLNPY
jgi:transketolase